MIKITNDSLLLISPNISIRDALRAMDKSGEGILFVVDKNQLLLGTLTDGDLRRGILNGIQISDSIDSIYNKKPFVFQENSYSEENAKRKMQDGGYKVIPILSEFGKIIAFEKWNDLLQQNKTNINKEQLDLPVVIMAGGKGTRMAPFTNVLPKPLVPIGDKTILEIIIDQFLKYGINNYYFTVNYRAEMIQAYFNSIEKKYTVNYIREKDFFGTAGSLSLLPLNFSPTFIVTNCDILVKADLVDVVAFHHKSKALVTVVSSIQHYTIPYGVIKFENGGKVKTLEEKPEYHFCINTGFYILDSRCLKYIPKDKVFHMTNLMELLIADGENVVTYPVNEKEYLDFGQWEEYRNAVVALGGS